MGLITFLKQTAASVPTPAANKASVFIDAANGEPKYKDESGLVIPLVGGFDIARVVALGSTSIPSAGAAQIWGLNPSGALLPSGVSMTGLLSAASGPGADFYLDPADYEISGLEVKFKLTVVCMTPDTASTITHTVGLYPITGSLGATTALEQTVGAVIAGSTAAFENQAAKTIAVKTVEGIEVVKGLYALGDLTSGTNTTNCRTVVIAKLQAYWN